MLDAPNRSKVSVSVYVSGKARGKVAETSISPTLQVFLIVNEGATVCMVKTKLPKTLIFQKDQCHLLCEWRFQESAEASRYTCFMESNQMLAVALICAGWRY